LFLLPWGRRSEQLWLLLDVFLETILLIIWRHPFESCYQRWS
jgi:hypothetical protein